MLSRSNISTSDGVSPFYVNSRCSNIRLSISLFFLLFGFHRMKASFSILSLLAAGSAGHTIFQELYVNGVSSGHEQGIRVVEYDGVSVLFFASYKLHQY